MVFIRQKLNNYFYTQTISLFQVIDMRVTYV